MGSDAELSSDGYVAPGNHHESRLRQHLPNLVQFGEPPPAAPTIRPPHSKFHPVPVRPVFLPPGVPYVSAATPEELSPPEPLAPDLDENSQKSLRIPDSQDLPHTDENARPIGPPPPSHPRHSPDSPHHLPGSDGSPNSPPGEVAPHSRSELEFDVNHGPHLKPAEGDPLLRLADRG
ncbi:MAG: hypothetical protein ACC628_10810 [Pirellulaceae bacterium]